MGEGSLLGTIVTVACAGTLAAALAVAAATDLARRVVPNGCVAAVAASGTARALIAAVALRAPGAPGEAALGAVTVLAVMLAAAAASSRRGGGSGVGGGDVKLLAALGTWLGPVAGLATVALSCLLAVLGWAVAALSALALRRRPPARAVPLAPAVAIAALLVLAFRPG